MHPLDRSSAGRLAAQHLNDCDLGPEDCEACADAERALAEEDERMTCEARDWR